MKPIINAERLWDSIAETSRFGATPRGGICRLALGDEDRRVRDWLTRACTEAGCTVGIDDLGNIFATRRGKLADAPPIAIGSHLDTQPTGGKFDGVLGVLSGLEILRAFQESGVETRHPIQLIDWTNEEGARFAPAMLGSGVFSGALEKEYALTRSDSSGRSVRDELLQIGYSGEESCGAHPLKAYFELHIEQGPVLEAEGHTLGIVEGAQGMRWYELEIKGEEAHAGTTPMHLRRDALLAAADLVREIESLARIDPPHALATVGILETRPGSRNVVPGNVFMTADLRHPNDEKLQAMEDRLAEVRDDLARRYGVEIECERIWVSNSVSFDPDCVASVCAAAKASGQSHRMLLSGAGHDAVYLSRTVPTAMIFIPCKGGISHNELESATKEDVGAGADVLARTLLEHDRL